MKKVIVLLLVFTCFWHFMDVLEVESDSPDKIQKLNSSRAYYKCSCKFDRGLW